MLSFTQALAKISAPLGAVLSSTKSQAIQILLITSESVFLVDLAPSVSQCTNQPRMQNLRTPPFYFAALTRATPEEKAMYDYIRLTVPHSLPLGIVEEKLVCDFSKNDASFAKRTVRIVILSLTKCIEEQISKEMQDREGAIM